MERAIPSARRGYLRRMSSPASIQATWGQSSPSRKWDPTITMSQEYRLRQTLSLGSPIHPCNSKFIKRAQWTITQTFWFNRMRCMVPQTLPETYCTVVLAMKDIRQSIRRAINTKWQQTWVSLPWHQVPDVFTWRTFRNRSSRSAISSL